MTTSAPEAMVRRMIVRSAYGYVLVHRLLDAEGEPAHDPDHAVALLGRIVEDDGSLGKWFQAPLRSVKTETIH